MLRIDSDEQVDEKADFGAVWNEPEYKPTASTLERSHYRAGRGFDLVAGAASALLVVGLIASLAWIRMSVPAHSRQEVVLLNLTPTPPAPTRAKPTEKPKIVKSQPIVAPLPTVAVSHPTPVATATPVQAPPTVAAPPAPVSAPVNVPAPPSVSGPADGGDLSSKMISAKPPTYPLESRRLHEEGTVVLTVLLNTDGRVVDISIAQGSGSERLDRAALGAVKSWRWAPVIRNGAPAMVQGRVKIPFVLKH